MRSDRAIWNDFVTGPPSLGSIIVNEVCATSLSISWDTDIHPVCAVRAQLVTISSSSSSAARTFDATDNNFTFTDLSSTTSYVVTIILRYKRDQLITRSATIVTSPLHRMSGTAIISHKPYIYPNISKIIKLNNTVQHSHYIWIMFWKLVNDCSITTKYKEHGCSSERALKCSDFCFNCSIEEYWNAHQHI